MQHILDPLRGACKQKSHATALPSTTQNLALYFGRIKQKAVG